MTLKKLPCAVPGCDAPPERVRYYPSGWWCWPHSPGGREGKPEPIAKISRKGSR